MKLTALIARVAFDAAQPFPHAVIENMIPIAWVREINAEWPIAEDAWRSHRHKHSDKRACPYRSRFGASTRKLIDSLNSPSFISHLEEWTGIQGLQADAELHGGGLHETFPGGFLDLHADFNRHPETRQHRRLNLLLYLNEGWQAHWGGALLLQDNAVFVEVVPTAGTAVLFATTDKSFHGHPTPLACPADRSRRSIALYYYSAERPASEMSREHSTLYLGEEASWQTA